MGVIHNLKEGGQTWTHSVRMVRQVLRTTAVVSLTVGLFVLCYRMSSLDSDDYWSIWYQGKATICQPFQDNISVDTGYWGRAARSFRAGTSADLPISSVLKVTEPRYNTFATHLTQNSTEAAKLSGFSFLAMTAGFMLRGKLRSRTQHISGSRVVSVWNAIIRLKLRKDTSPIKIGPLPMVKGTETQHMLISGGTGSGKSNCLHHILPQIRTAGQRAVIVDPTGEFVERYYREGKDVILSPFDERSVPWHPWVECEDRFDYASIAESFIPNGKSESDNYWRTAGRSVFSAVLEKTAQGKKTSQVVRLLLKEPLKELCDFVAGTKAAAHLDLNSEKTAGSVRSVVTSFVDCLECLEDTEDPFSIRKWIQEDQGDGWLFIVTKPSHRAAVRPLVSSWISIATRSLLQMQPDRDRRLWFVIDELPSFQKLKDIELFLTESRKYGGCGLFSIQSPAQIEDIYGWEASRVIVGNCMTRVAFREQDPEIAARVSKIFGENETKQYQEGISYGAHEMRDGVNISSQIRERPVVSATAIQTLDQNEAFVRLPGNNPIARVKLSIAHK
jgi:type IV conjugative transfer system coupling protein TraD